MLHGTAGPLCIAAIANVQNVVPKEFVKEVNYSIAFFLRDLLTLVDRGRAFRIIRSAFMHVSPSPLPSHSLPVPLLAIAFSLSVVYFLTSLCLLLGGCSQSQGATPDRCRQSRHHCSAPGCHPGKVHLFLRKRMLYFCHS